MSRTVEELRTAAGQRLSAVERAGREIEAIREPGESDGADVLAVVDGSGALVALRLSSGATNLSPTTLGELIVQAATRAASRATQRVRTLRALAEGDAIAHAWDLLHDPHAARDPIPAVRPRPPGSDGDELSSFDPATLRSDR